MATSKSSSKEKPEAELAELIETVSDMAESSPSAEAIDPPKPETAHITPQPSPRRSGAFAGFVLGGILAAAGGYGLARFGPEGLLVQTGSPTAEATLAAQAEEIAALNAKLTDLASRPVVDEAAIVAKLQSTIDASLAALPKPADPTAAIAEVQTALDARLAALDQRLTEVEKRPAGQGGAASTTALAAYDRELQSLRDQISALGAGSGATAAELQAMADQVKAELSAATAEIRQLDATAAADAALGRIQSALEVGGPFADALKSLSSAGISVPEALSAAAESGTETLTELQRSFPEAARAALEAARRSDMGAGWTDRLTSFFKVQTGVRSLEPREGADTDAVLSRAEAALASGQLTQVLTELAMLSDSAKAAMAGWLAKADARQSATVAFETLIATMSNK